MAQTKKVRKGPSESATKFSVGTKKQGNDGNMWKIVENKNGTRRWQKETSDSPPHPKVFKFKKGVGLVEVSVKNKVKAKKGKTQKLKTNTKAVSTKGKVYFTHDNGSRPFMVDVNGNNVDIYTHPTNLDLDYKLDKKDYNILVKSYKNVKQIFIGKSIKGDDMYASYKRNPAKAMKAGLGNSFLLNLSGNKYVFIGESVYEFDCSRSYRRILFYDWT